MHNTKIFLDVVKDINPHADIKKVERAVLFAQNVHKDQKRNSGEPYITHPLMVTQYLLQQGLSDTTSICAALLHDCVEDGEVTAQDIAKNFGEDVAAIVEGLTKVARTENFENYEAENLRKIILASAKDVRVLIIKLCDILHNLNTIEGLAKEKQERYAKLSLYVYAALAESIGLYRIKGEIEERCLEILHPVIFKHIQEHVRYTREQREQKTDEVIILLKKTLAEHKMIARVYGRAKYLYSVFEKMHKHNKTIDKIYDLYGVRILAQNIDDCYKIHKLFKDKWPVVPGRYKDYISVPKLNGYQSLHDNFVIDGNVLEVQIRTEEMNKHAEFGPAIISKSTADHKEQTTEKITQLARQMIIWITRNADKRSIDHEKFDPLRGQIIVITPKGDPVALKERSTVLDFAFAVHSNVGIHAKGARVNGVERSLNTELKSGDIVKIITDVRPRVSSHSLNLVRTKQARSSILQYLDKEKGVHSIKQPNRKRNDRENLIHSILVDHECKQLVLADCCKVKYGNKIGGVYENNKHRIIIHALHCKKIASAEKSKIVNAQWMRSDEKKISISCEDRPGMLIDVLQSAQKAGITIIGQSAQVTKNSLVVSLDYDGILSSLQKKELLGVLREKSKFVSIEYF